MPQALEFHQLDRRLEHLRVRHPPRFRRLLASLAETGQQPPIVVVPHEQRYLVIDGHQRIAALLQLRRDTVDAVVLETISEAEALLRFAPCVRTASRKRRSNKAGCWRRWKKS